MKTRILILSILTLLLIGCAGMFERRMFGMPESQFRALNPAQQQQVIDAYNQRELVRTQNEPINSLIGIAGGAVRRDQGRSF